LTVDLPLIFALVAAAAVALYVLADGFDLGVGILFLLAPRESDRDIMMQSIAPFWDGNETWLVFGGALLWAAFPIAYYVLLPAFYLPIVIMLIALIARGVAFEFRFQAVLFRRVWDFVFAGGSLLAVVAQGLVLGRFIAGVPVANGVFSGGPFSSFTVLGLFCAAGLVGGYALLGAGWLIWKTEGPTQVFGREVGHSAVILSAGCMALVSTWTALTVPEVAERWFRWPWVLPLALMPLAAAGVAFLIWRLLWGRHETWPFRLTILLFLLGFGGLTVSIWPYVVPRVATIWSGAADPTTLRFVGVGVLVIVPIILAYLGHAYWVFRGKTLPEGGYGEPKMEGHVGRRAQASQIDLHLS
jgi:cytochrome bd ubiquinol oxidase subunit II